MKGEKFANEETELYCSLVSSAYAEAVAEAWYKLADRPAERRFMGHRATKLSIHSRDRGAYMAVYGHRSISE